MGFYHSVMFSFHDLVFYIISQILTNKKGIKKTNIKCKLPLLLLPNWRVHTN